MREYEEILQYDRKIITFLKAQIPPLLRRQIRIMIAHHKKLVPFQPGEKFPASLLTAGAEIAQMIHKVMIAHDRVPSPDHFQIHRVGIRKRPFFIKSYILITEVGVSDQEDPAVCLISAHIETSVSNVSPHEITQTIQDVRKADFFSLL